MTDAEIELAERQKKLAETFASLDRKFDLVITELPRESEFARSDWEIKRVDGAPDGLRPFYGTTLRFYDPAIAAWRLTWIDPLNGRVRRFIGRPEGGDIVLEGLDDDPTERWGFRDITEDSFRWTGEVSEDGRRTWRLDEQMLIRRRGHG